MPTPNNLPQQMTSFIGRERQVAEVERLLSGNSLLTLTGMGGAGKTRLALRVASGLLDKYPGGVWMVELGALSDPTMLPQAVATTLGVRDEPGRDLARLITSHVGDVETLLILDNCEHMVEACAILADTLLRACPALHILATSRQGLGLAYEAIWPVPILTLPDPQGRQSADVVAQYEAVQLFVERARLKCPDFSLTPESAPWVAQICTRLDGIPLAIELAAARARVLSVEQIARRLDESLRLLSTPGQTQLAPARHKTLSALVDWSYDLLTEEERDLLRALSVFAGPFTLEAVQAVMGGTGDQFSVIDLLSQLVDKSLVLAQVQGRDGRARYRLLETIRQYASEKLAASGAAKDTIMRHRDWYLGLAEESESWLVGDEQLPWLERLEEEHDNLRAALASVQSGVRAGVQGAGVERGDLSGSDILSAEAGLRLAGALAWFWYFRGYLREGRTWLEKMLENTNDGVSPPVLAKALSATGILAFLQSDYPAARGYLERGMQIWRELGDTRGIAFTGTFLGRTATRQGDPQGRALSEESAALFRRTGEKWGLALSLDFLGQVVRDWGDEQGASVLHGESLILYQEMGHKWGVALETSNAGRIALREGDYVLARTRLEEALSIQQEVGDKRAIAWTLHPLGDLSRAEGDLARAVSFYEESLGIFRELGDKEGLASSLALLAEAAELRGDEVRAGELRTESQALFDALDTADGEMSVQIGIRRLEAARVTVGAEGYPPAPHAALPDDLTKREGEVLKLIADGLTAAQVADRLSLSPRTVQAHVRSIYTKLGVTSRSAVTRYAVEHGLG